MTYKILITAHFKKQLKELKKKDKDIKTNLITGLNQFQKSTSIHIGKGVYKIRLGKANKGKSGGYRIYIFLIEIDKILVPLCIHAKNKVANLTLPELTEHMNRIKTEISNPGLPRLGGGR